MGYAKFIPFEKKVDFNNKPFALNVFLTIGASY